MYELEPEKKPLLDHLYRASKGSLSHVFSSERVADDLGWSADQVYRLVVDCCMEGLLKHVGSSGRDVAFRLASTPWARSIADSGLRLIGKMNPDVS